MSNAAHPAERLAMLSAAHCTVAVHGQAERTIAGVNLSGRCVCRHVKRLTTAGKNQRRAAYSIAQDAYVAELAQTRALACVLLGRHVADAVRAGP